MDIKGLVQDTRKKLDAIVALKAEWMGEDIEKRVDTTAIVFGKQLGVLEDNDFYDEEVVVSIATQVSDALGGVFVLYAEAKKNIDFSIDWGMDVNSVKIYKRDRDDLKSKVQNELNNCLPQQKPVTEEVK